MATDAKNILRVDLPEIYNDCQVRTELKAQSLGIDPDVFAFTANTKNLLHSFAMEGASLIADYAGYVKNCSQTGINALTYDEDSDNPEEVLNEFDKPVEVMGRVSSKDEKLDKGHMDFALFQIEDVESNQNKYTVVQQFIKAALTHYILMKWYLAVSQPNSAQEEYAQYEIFLGKVKNNSIENFKHVGLTRPYRLY